MKSWHFHIYKPTPFVKMTDDKLPTLCGKKINRGLVLWGNVFDFGLTHDCRTCYVVLKNLDEKNAKSEPHDVWENGKVMPRKIWELPHEEFEIAVSPIGGVYVLRIDGVSRVFMTPDDFIEMAKAIAHEMKVIAE